MAKPGAYVADVTEGITDPAQLPKAAVQKRLRSRRQAPCPRCGKSCYRDSEGARTLHDLGRLRSNRPVDLQVCYSKHRCEDCQIYFNTDMSGLAPPGAHYTQRVIQVLDHAPAHADIEKLFVRFKAALDVRGLMLQGITTDGAPLYPEPLAKVFGAVFSPNLEKALTFLDDALLPATSNAVERSNRRHRKMQKSVYRVRTLRSLTGRIALDLYRERHRSARFNTTFTLHLARAG